MYLKPSRRKKRRRRVSLLITVAIIAAAVFAVFFCLDHFTDFSFTRPLLKETQDLIPENATANTNGILYTKDGTLYLVDQAGAALWDLKLDGGEPARFTSSEKMIASYTQNAVQVMTFSKEQLFSTSIDSGILDVRCGNSLVAVLTSSTDETTGMVKYYIYLFNDKGEQSGQQIELSTKPVVNFGFSGDNDMLWALSLDTSGVVPISYITTYKSDGGITGSIEINTQLIEDIYVTADSIYASGTESLLSYNYFGEKQGDASIYGWEPFACYNGETLQLAYISRADSVNIESTKIYTNDLSSRTVRLPRSAFSLAISQDRLFVYTENEIYVYSFDGKLEQSTKIEKPIKKAKQVSNELAIVWDADKSYIMQLT